MHGLLSVLRHESRGVAKAYTNGLMEDALIGFKIFIDGLLYAERHLTG